MLNFKPKQTVKKLIMILPERNQDIIVQRFGLGQSSEAKTLDAIGKNYGITRERVRQIENFSLNTIRKHDSYSAIKDALDELKSHINERGGIVSEAEFLNYLSNDANIRNHIYFMLVLGDDFTKIKEDDEFSHRWTIDKDKATNAHDVLQKIHNEISEEDVFSENEIIEYLKKQAVEILKQNKIQEEAIRSWLSISKLLDKNALGEWGSVNSPSIKPRGMRDLAYLVIKRHGSPMHFNEVAETITKVFGKKAHPATVHNELIKDTRFILVGRGLYALKDWGYSTGVVSDVIKNILKSSGPLSKEEVVKRVLKERYIKENTILVNLQNRKYFKRNKDGLYTVV